MFQAPAPTYMMRNQLPSPDYTGDSDSDNEIILELEHKRRQIDEEIARFKAKKDQEFNVFKQELRTRKQSRRDPRLHPYSSESPFFRNNSPSATPSTTPPTQHVNVPDDEPVQRHTRTSSNRQSQPFRLMNPSSAPRATAPTLRLDKLNIASEQMSRPQIQTPPTPSLSTSQSSPRTSNESIVTPSSKDIVAVKSVKMRSQESLSGLFTSSFLPLLDNTSSNTYYMSCEHIEESQTAPASPNPGCLIEESTTIRSSSLPSEVSMSPGFPAAHTKRAHTAPSGVSRRALAPIIRNVNGRSSHNRKRKHVKFQLADRAIVEPSSSYEEGPSPGCDSEESTTSGDYEKSSGNDNTEKESDLFVHKLVQKDPLGRRKPQAPDLTTPEEDIGMGMGDLMLAEDDYLDDSSADSYFTPKHDHANKRPPSSKSEKAPTLQPYEDNASNPGRYDLLTLKHSSFEPPPNIPHEMGVDVDETAREKIGFFELDEELASPNAGTPQPFEHVEEIEDVNLELNLSPPTRKADVPDKDLPAPDGMHGLGITEMATSVPIDIKPLSSGISSSWIGTFGH